MGEGQGTEGRLNSFQKTAQDVGFGDRPHSRCSKGSLGQMAEAKEDGVNPIRASWREGCVSTPSLPKMTSSAALTCLP
jgi:hypothetical protein